MQNVGRQISQRGAHGERGQNGGPIKELTPQGENAVDRQRVLHQVPGNEDGGQDNGKPGSGYCIGDIEADVQDVGAHRPEHGDHYDG